MYIDENTFNYVQFTDVSPTVIVEGLQQMVNARLAAIAARTTVDDGARDKVFSALTELMNQQRNYLLEADANDENLPMIEHWWFARRLTEPFIIVVGEVRGHPHLPDGPINTSPLYHWDAERNLIATQNTIYRIGEKRDILRALKGQ